MLTLFQLRLSHVWLHFLQDGGICWVLFINSSCSLDYDLDIFRFQNIYSLHDIVCMVNTLQSTIHLFTPFIHRETSHLKPKRKCSSYPLPITLLQFHFASSKCSHWNVFWKMMFLIFKPEVFPQRLLPP